MAVSRSRTIWTNLSSGMLDPSVASRIDIEAYRNGASDLTNWRLLIQGGATNRPATKYHADLTSLVKVQIERFVFNADQAYCFVFSNTKLDIYDESGTFVQQLTSCPWTTTEIGSLRVRNAFDTMIVCHEDMPIDKITRTSATTFAREAFAFEAHSSGVPVYQPYYKFAAAAMTLTPSATTGSITLTTSATHWQDPGHVGAKVRYEGKECTITSITSGTIANADVDETLPGTSASADWDEQVFGAAYGYAKIPFWYKQRLLLGSHKNLPQFLWGSQISAFFNFDVGAGLPNEAIFHGIFEPEVGEIVNILDGGNLMVMTDGGEYWMEVSPEIPFGPDTIDFKPTSRVGSKGRYSTPEMYDGAIVFVDKRGQALRELRYSDTFRSYTVNQVATLSLDLIKTPVRIEVLRTSGQAPESYMVVQNTDGTLAAYHSLAQEKIAGWVPWTFGGDPGTDKVYDMCAVDTTFFVVMSRTVNGSSKLYLESFDLTETLDSFLTYDFGDDTNLGLDATDFSGAAWAATNASVSTDTTTDPDGTSLADTLTEDATASAVHQLTQTYAGWTNGNEYRLRVFAKAETGDRDLHLEFPAAAFPASVDAQFDISGGTVRATGAGLSQAEITPYTGGWYLCEIVAIADATASGDFIVGLDDTSSNSYNGDGASGLYLHRCELIREPQSILTGLGHLEGQEVHVISGDSYLGAYTVSSSQINMGSIEAYTATVGYSYLPSGKTLPPELQLEDGPSHGEKRRVVHVTFDLQNTLALQVGSEKLLTRTVDEDLSDDPAPVTGVYKFPQLGWSEKGEVTFAPDLPLRVQIDSVTVEVMI